MDQVATDLIKHGNHLFSKRDPLHSRWQELVDNFYPERDGFTDPKNLEDDFAAHLVTSEPVVIRRDLGDSISAILRRDKWFGLGLPREEMEDNQAVRFLEWMADTQRRAMYDPDARLTRACKECDHDYVTFGQGVISVEFNPRKQALLHRAWHLKDVVWSESIDGDIDTFHRNQKICAGLLSQRFKNIHEKAKKVASENPYQEILCRHIVVPADRLNDKKFARYPFVSLWVDVDNDHVMEMVGAYDKTYVIPRWMMIGSSQYAMSPAAMVALPDARLVQQMMLTLLEAGEKAVNPPLLVREKLLKGGIELYANGLTYIDSDHDSRNGRVMEPVYDSKTSNLPLGMEMIDRSMAGLRDQFYLNKIRLPQMQPNMTAYEFAERMKEYARNILPIIEPTEAEYNAQLCDRDFEILMRHNVFGNPRDWPQSVLKAGRIDFRFTSPFTEALERVKGSQLQELKGIVQLAAEIDPTVPNRFNFATAAVDAAKAIGIPAKWSRSAEEIEEMDAAQEQQQAAMAMAQGAAAVSEIPGAMEAMSEA